MAIARTAARGSMGLVQDILLENPAWHVPRIRTRLLKAVLEPIVLAMQATVAAPAQGIAQRA